MLNAEIRIDCALTSAFSVTSAFNIPTSALQAALSDQHRLPSHPDARNSPGVGIDGDMDLARPPHRNSLKADHRACFVRIHDAMVQ
jgi:hypothetical protein